MLILGLHNRRALGKIVEKFSELKTVTSLFRVRTKNRNHFSRTFQGLFKDQIEFSRTPYQGGNLTDGI